MAKRQKIEFDELFQADVDQYYDFANQYALLNPESFTLAFELSQRAWVLADRWNDLTASCAKLGSLKGGSKTDLSKYCYGKYRQLHLAHEHCRMIWGRGERETKARGM